MVTDQTSRSTSGKRPHPGSGPSGPIQHVVIMVKENHGFDHYFGTFPGAEGMAMPRSPNPPPTDPDRRHGAYGGYAFDFIHDLHGKPKLASDQFVQDASQGKLPTVSWLYAPHDASEHAPDPSDHGNPLVGNVTHGMQWTVDQVNAIEKGGLWPKTADMSDCFDYKQSPLAPPV